MAGTPVMIYFVAKLDVPLGVRGGREECEKAGALDEGRRALIQVSLLIPTSRALFALTIQVLGQVFGEIIHKLH